MPGRHLDQKQFQAVILKLALNANKRIKSESLELTAPVRPLLCSLGFRG
jgi:hypothetical protein